MAGIALVAIAYAGAAQLSYSLEFAGPVAAIVWLPVGVGIACLYFGGFGLFPGVVIGDLLANDYSTLPLGSALGQTCGNLIEVVLAVVIIRRLVRRGSPLDSLGGVGVLVLAIATGTAVSATIGTTSLWLGGVLEDGAMPTIWRTWWLGDFAGALVVVPLALAWSVPLRLPSRAQLAEGAGLAAAVAGLSYVASSDSDPIIYLTFPALIWSALRFGRRGATLAIAMTVGIVVWNTTHHAGPFVYHSITTSVIQAQLFVGVAATSTLILAAMVSERERYLRELALHIRLEATAQAERRQIEQDLHDGAQQRLVWIGSDLHRAAKMVDASPGELRPLLERTEGEIQLALDELRRLAHGIHPVGLVELGLRGAIPALANRSSNVTITCLPAQRFADNVETTAYYVVAEAVVNAQKHSGASSIRVRVTVVDDVLQVEVDDDGVGGANSAGSGLLGLRDRVSAMGGTLEVASPPGHGTRITAAIPIGDSARP